MNFVIIPLICIFCLILMAMKKRNIHIWIFSYLKQCLKGSVKTNPCKPVHIVFCFVDHFEPSWNKASHEDEVRRIDAWIENYPKLASRHKDSYGKPPQHTFFYAQEEYKTGHLNKLSGLCQEGFGAVEIHLHHNDDTPDGLRQKIEGFKIKLTRHGLLSQDRNGQTIYGFIHGNWSLDNSRKDGRWCGINNELQVLKETGCYADFTLPSAPSETQTKKINSIYYAKDDPQRPKSHNAGIDVEAGKNSSQDLMIIQGPLTLDWKNRKWKIFPRIENGKIDAINPPTNDRVDLWIKQHICVKGKPNWVFVKVYTHGCQEKNFETLFGNPADKMFGYLEAYYNDGKRYQLHYVTAREMFDIIKKLESEQADLINEE